MGAAEGTNPRKIRTIDLIFALTVTACGALFFMIVMRAMNGNAQSEWLVPLASAAIYMAILSIFAVTVGIKKLLSPIIFISLLPSVILMPVIQHIAVVISMYVILMYGLLTMRHTLFNLLRIDMGMIVRSGIFYVCFSLIVIVTSQYYFFLKEYVEPVFDATDYVGAVNVVIDAMLEKSNVENISSVDNMTIDDFLSLIIQDVAEQNKSSDGAISENERSMFLRLTENMDIAIEKIQNEAEAQAVESMKSAISEKIGRDIYGDELASRVLSELITVQLHGIIMNNRTLYEHRAGFFATVFFAILVSIAQVVKFFAVVFARIGFLLLRECHLVRLTRAERDAEMIAL